MMTESDETREYLDANAFDVISNPSILQYVYLMDHEGKLLTCDEAGKQLLSRIDLGFFYAHLQSLKLNAAITNTTILFDNKSYNLRMVPINLHSKKHIQLSLNPDATEYIIVLQDQALFSHLFQKLNQAKPFFESKGSTVKNQLDQIFEFSSNGIFMSNLKRNVVYANSAYENATGLSRKDIIGKNLVDLENTGVLNPLITPTILETGNSITTLQELGTGKKAIICGSPIYDSIGTPSLIVTCVNVITEIAHANTDGKYHTPAIVDLNINRRKNEHSIDVIAESTVMKTILQEAIKVARYDVTVLLLGDSGVGKEVLASVIHASSKRNNANFVKINCSAISPSLLESELFGYEAGSFTGALSTGKPGLFEIANNGTILLDEIGDMSIDLQAKLLRVIQNREFYRVGSFTPTKCNVRIIASTNRDLEKMIESGEFRQDLYYRLNVVSINLPTLKERKADIRPLLLHFNYYYNRLYSTNKQFSNELIEVLENYQWPGNIRELQNLVERLTVLCIEDFLLPEHLYSKYKVGRSSEQPQEDVQVNRLMPMKEAINLLEKKLVAMAMHTGKTTRAAAELLGVSQSTIMRRIKEDSDFDQ